MQNSFLQYVFLQECHSFVCRSKGHAFQELLLALCSQIPSPVIFSLYVFKGRTLNMNKVNLTNCAPHTRASSIAKGRLIIVTSFCLWEQLELLIIFIQYIKVQQLVATENHDFLFVNVKVERTIKNDEQNSKQPRNLLKTISLLMPNLEETSCSW